MGYRSKKVSTSFTVILILLALITAAFLYKFFCRQGRKAIATYTAVNHPHKKHKRKHKIKNKIAINSVNHKADTVKAPHLTGSNKTIITDAAAPLKTAITQPAITKPITVKTDSNRAVKPNNTFLYTTYVQPNITGIVKMRAQDKFYSNIIATIPANSKVLVLAKGATYYRVSYNNNIGFVPRWALQIK